MSGIDRRFVAADTVRDLARDLAPPPPDPAIRERVAALIERVRLEDDDAIVALTSTLDAPGFSADRIAVPAAALSAAARALDPTLREAITTAAAQVRALAEQTRPADRQATLPFGQQILARAVPMDAVGLWVPGGRAAYPSSVIMGVVPAQVAGVERIVVATPPGDAGDAHSVILGTAALLGVEEVYVGAGAAMIAALAYGTSTVTPVSFIAGPGSAWVQEAKRQVFGVVGIDGIAGPSEIVVVADGTADPGELAADLLAQSEHGPDSPAILVSPDRDLVDGVAAALTEANASGAITLIDCDDRSVAVAFAEAFAPEHLQLQCRDAAAIAATIRFAGAVFVGQNGGTAFGDYVAGSNHIIPTGGAARFASSVSAATFMRRMSVVELPDAAVVALTPHLAAVADAEGFVNHRRSAEVRAARIAGEGGAR